MATTYKVLGQQTCGTANGETVVYTVPNGSQAIISDIVVCNESISSRTYRLAARGGGAALATKHYLAKDATLLAHATTLFTVGMTLGSGDIISFSDGTGSNDVACSVFGAEIS